MNKQRSVIRELQDRVLEFGETRNWGKFHSPKNIAMALNVEAAELLEIFQWLTETQSKTLNEQQLQDASMEVADVFMYTLLICAKLGIDLEAATKEKLQLNELRFEK